MGDVKEIALAEIDPSAIEITNLREISFDSEHFKELCKQLDDKDIGQREPIIIRKLREGEQGKEGTNYGILDGHHRYAAFKKLEKEKIRAEIIESKDEITDLIRVFGVNLSHKSLESWQMGKIVVELKERSKSSVTEIAEKLGIARSTAFKYQAAYKKHLEKDGTKKKKEKTVGYDQTKLESILSGFKLNSNLTDEESYKTEISRLSELSAQLSAYKRILSEKLKSIKSAE